MGRKGERGSKERALRLKREASTKQQAKRGRGTGGIESPSRAPKARVLPLYYAPFVGVSPRLTRLLHDLFPQILDCLLALKGHLIPVFQHDGRCLWNFKSASRSIEQQQKQLIFYYETCKGS